MEQTIFVKSDEVLFNRWKKLGLYVDQLKSSVQNDMDITAEDVREWRHHAEKVQRDLNVLIKETLAHLGAAGGT